MKQNWDASFVFVCCKGEGGDGAVEGKRRKKEEIERGVEGVRGREREKAVEIEPFFVSEVKGNEFIENLVSFYAEFPRDLNNDSDGQIDWEGK